MIQIKCMLTDNSTIEKTLTFDEYYDKLDEGESYLDDGVERFLDQRDYLNIDRDKIEELVIESPNEIQTINYGPKGSIKIHINQKNGHEWLIIQSKIDHQFIHNIKLVKYKNEQWKTKTIEIINDNEGTIKSIL